PRPQGFARAATLRGSCRVERQCGAGARPGPRKADRYRPGTVSARVETHRTLGAPRRPPDRPANSAAAGPVTSVLSVSVLLFCGTCLARAQATIQPESIVRALYESGEWAEAIRVV